jgi:hypothetical protein
MSQTPPIPPGIERASSKHTDLTAQQYSDAGDARLGELVVDVSTNPDNPSLYIGNVSGNLNLVSGGSGGNPGGSNTQIQFNNNGLFGASSSFTFTSTSNLVSIANLTVSGNTQLGDVSNVFIEGGTSGYVLSTDGTGNLSWIDAAAALIGGPDTAVQYNDGGVLGGTTNFTYDSTGDLLTVGNISAIGNISANYFIGDGGLLTNITVSGGTAIVNGTSNITVATSGNITVGVNGNANVVTFTGAGAVIDGTLNINGNNEQQQINGTRTIIAGNPYPGSAANNVPTVVWTSSSNNVNSFLMTLRIQNSGEVEILELMAAMNASLAISFTETNRVTTNPAILDTIANVAANGTGYMQVILTPKNGNIVYATYNVTEFNKTV